MNSVPQDRLPRLLSIQDISCVGKCSLGAALPVVSALGVECAVLPTAVLSTHTAGFGPPHVRDLTGDIAAILAHWETAGVGFDCVCSGYLAGSEQISLVQRIFAAYPTALKIADPAMADNGRLYSGFDAAFVEAIKPLVQEADVILPNFTEASLLTGVPYSGERSEEYADRLLDALCSMGVKTAVLTGVERGALIGARVLNGDSGLRFSRFAARSEQAYHGTGDLFCAVFAASLIRKLAARAGEDARYDCAGIEPGGIGITADALEQAVHLAVDFVSACAAATACLPPRRRCGVAFERCLGMLTDTARA